MPGDAASRGSRRIIDAVPRPDKQTAERAGEAQKLIFEQSTLPDAQRGYWYDDPAFGTEWPEPVGVIWERNGITRTSTGDWHESTA